MMRKLMNGLTAALLAATALTVALRQHDASIPLALPITLGTFAYHFAMRLVVGLSLGHLLHAGIDPDNRWFAPHSWEPALYKALHIKRWKSRMPTYHPGNFDPRQRTWAQIAQAMCVAELVHEAIVVLSFLPLVVCVAMGDAADVPVFAITSTLAALIDLAFVVMQRYNRPRVLRIARRRGHASAPPSL